MPDPLYDLFAGDLDTNTSTSSSSSIGPSSPTVVNYLARLTTISLPALSSTEPQSLAQSASSNLLSLQALSSRSHKPVITASNALSKLGEHLPTLTSSASSLRADVSELDGKALSFSQKYSKVNAENAVLDRRKKAMLLSRNVDRVSDILELPTLLATIIASSSPSAASSGSAPTGASYSQALDLFAHVKRLQITHPDSSLLQSVLVEAEDAMKDMTSNLITSLRGQSVRLAAAIRTIGWLKRVAPELAVPGLPPAHTKSGQGSTYPPTAGSNAAASEGVFSYLFLSCRLYNLLNMLEALNPLRDLADQETQQRLQSQGRPAARSNSHDRTNARRKPSVYSHLPFTGQQTERYLKRYIEIFREQSFATMSMYKNIFPPASEKPFNTIPTSPTTHLDAALSASKPAPLATPSILTGIANTTDEVSPPFLTLPTPLSTFPSHLVSLLTETLQLYLPNLTDPSARDSLLMQVLYAAGSLGRLGADFSMVIATLLLDDDDDEDDRSEDSYNDAAVDQKIMEHAKSDHAPPFPSKTIAKPTADNVSQDHRDVDGGEGERDGDKDKAPSQVQKSVAEKGERQKRDGSKQPIPEWVRIVKKHRVQSSKLEAMSSGQ